MTSLSVLAGVPSFLLARELRARSQLGSPDMSFETPPPAALRQALRPISDPELAAGLLEQLRNHACSVYGPDDRVEAYEVQRREHLQALACTAAIFLDAAVQAADDGLCTLATRSFGAVKQLCPGVRFYNQPIGAAATGVLVGPDLLLTAAHVIRRVPHERARVVFGFHMDNPFAARERIPAADVYRILEVVARGEGQPPRGDWVLLRLDRRADDRPFADLAPDHPLPPGHPIYTVGHPMGLPVKLAGNARVLATGDADHFTANLDVFPACSGSPVFDAETHALAGIVLADPKLDHFIPVDGCYVHATFPDDDSVGNQHLRAHHFAAAVRGAQGL